MVRGKGQEKIKKNDILRLTSNKSDYECRCDHCEAEEWFYDKYGKYPEDICEGCPFIKFINKLAEYEDREEKELKK